MKKLVTNVGLLAAMTAPLAYADSYQTEVSLSYGQSERDPIETDSYNVTGIAHFKTVDTKEHPLEEAAFLERSSYVELGYTHDDTDDGTDDDNKDNTFNMGVHLNTGERYFIDLDLIKSNMENADLFGAGLGFGAYVQDNITVDVSYLDLTFEPDGGSKVTGAGYGVSGRGVFELGGQQAIAVEGGFTVIDFDSGVDNQEIFSVEGRYYFLRTTHVGLGYSMTSSDDEDVDGFTLEAQHFITPIIAVGASFGQESSDDDDTEDTDEYSLWAKVRF
ncbi:MAG: putative porin [Ketobacteraceae bacterium]|nr:putative porin [Ketobacteraceae bacterium]